MSNILALSGELDASTAPAVAALLREHARANRSSVLIVDLAAVTFMDSSGMDPLARAHQELEASERLLVLASSPGPVLRLLHAVQPLGDFPLVDQTLRSARASHGAGGQADTVDADLAHLVQDATRLRAARHDRAVVEQAKGLLMGLHECDAGQASALLELVAGRRVLAVGDIAAGLVEMANARGRSPQPTVRDALVHAAVQATLGHAHALDLGSQHD